MFIEWMCFRLLCVIYFRQTRYRDARVYTCLFTDALYFLVVFKVSNFQHVQMLLFY